MAKKCKIKKQEQRVADVKRFAKKRSGLNLIIKDKDTSMEDRFTAVMQLAKLPRDSSKVRLHSRCELTGRPRAYYRKFKLCRIKFRELASNGLIPGVVKSSW